MTGTLHEDQPATADVCKTRGCNFHCCTVHLVSIISLTLRRLMSYIYIYMERIFLMFLDHTQRRNTVGRTSLDE